MSEICISEYEDDIEGASDWICSMLKEDYDSGEEAYAYAERAAEWEHVADLIVGNPEWSDAAAELFAAICEASKRKFKLKLLGTY